MRRIFILLCFFITGFSGLLKAQHCGFDELHARNLATHPSYAQQVQEMNAKIASMSPGNPLGLIVQTPNGAVYEIPVVVHVLHTGGAIGSAYNPSDAQITGMIDYLNQTYAATWPGYPDASSGGTEIPLRFTLAKRDPNCNPTTGIIRVNGSSNPTYAANGITADPGAPGASDATVKAMSRWPNSDYYNIWIVNKIKGNDGTIPGVPYTAGYAYFPGAFPEVDGTVLLASSSQAGSSVLPHEIGHAFALYHTFEDDNGGMTCPINNNCITDGDMVCDTDPHVRSPFNCPAATTNPCTGAPHGNVVRNIMDYSSCPDRFTPGQRTRVINALLSSRGSLISSLGATPPSGTAVTTACVPTGNTATLTGSNSGPRNIKISDANLLHFSVSSAGYSGDGNQHYLDHTCRQQAILTAGQIYEFSVSTGPQPEQVKVYIDYNNDGVFQTNEEIYAHMGSQSFEIHTFQYAVPTTATVPDLLSCVPLRMRVVSDRASIASVSSCGQLSYGQAEDYSIMILFGGASSGNVSVSLTSGTNPSCFNSPLTFTAVPAAGVTNASYEWYVNHAPTGITTNTFTSSTLNNGDIVSVEMSYTSACGATETTMSPDFTVNRQTSVPAAVSIALTTGTNPGCAGQQLSFTATPQNGGATPAYQWLVNGAPQGSNSPVFTAMLNDNDEVSVQLTSNSSCASPATATSNIIVIEHHTITADVSIQLVSGTLPACDGVPLTFEAFPVNGGTAPQYQWLVNSLPAGGAVNPVFTSSALQDGDEVTVTLSSSDVCVDNPYVTSAPIAVSILPTMTPGVFAGISNGSNPGCLDSLVEFTAIVNNHGVNADHTWFVNNIPAGFGLSYMTNTLQNGDIVRFRSIATDGACYSSDTMHSAPITMHLFATPAPVVISLIGTMIVANPSGGNIQWYGPDGPITGATGDSYHPTQPGLYYARTDNNGCLSKPSNSLMVSLLDIKEHPLSHIKIYPNPTSGVVHFDWGNKAVNASLEVYAPSGQKLMHNDVHQKTHQMLDLTSLASGMYFIVVRENGQLSGTVRISLMY